MKRLHKLAVERVQDLAAIGNPLHNLKKENCSLKRKLESLQAPSSKRPAGHRERGEPPRRPGGNDERTVTVTPDEHFTTPPQPPTHKPDHQTHDLQTLASTLAQAIRDGLNQASRDSYSRHPRRLAKRGPRPLTSNKVSPALPDLLPPAVVIRAKNGEYAKAMAIIKDEIQYRGLDAGMVTLRKTRTGNMLIELTHSDTRCVSATTLASIADE